MEENNFSKKEEQNLLIAYDNPNPVLRASSDGTILFANPASRFLENTFQEAKNRKLPDSWKSKILRSLNTNIHLREEFLVNGRIFSAYIVPHVQENFVNIFCSDVTELKEDRERLFESEQRFRDLLSASREGIVFHSLGIIIDMNEKIAELFGYQLEEIIGKSILDFMPIEEHELVMEKVKMKDPLPYITKVKRKNGEIVPVEIIGKVQEYRGRQIRVAILTDISQRIKAEEEIRKQQSLMNTLLDNLPVNIYLKDKQGKYVFVNQCASDEIKLRKDQIIGKTYAEIFPTASHKEILKSDEVTWMRGEFFSEDKTVVNGLEKYFLVGKFIISSEGSDAPLLLGYSIDITDRKRMELNLKKAKKELEESIQAKERFISIMSHEIRTPMNAVVGITNLLLQQVTNHEQKEYFNALKISSENLLKILNNVLDLSKIDSGKVSFEEIDFNPRNHLRKVKELFAFKAAEKNLKVKISIDSAIPEVLKGDPYRLSQILVNLLSNSLKFTDEGEIHLKANVLDENDMRVHVLFSVEDTGIGIPEDKLNNIFESFSQANSDITRKYGGTGLGLTITKKLIELQGGRIGVESQPGKGAKFMFDLYFTKSLLKSATTEIFENITDFSGLKVLVVEDNKMNQLVVSKFLEKKGVHPVIAENGREAVELLKKNSFELILMDLQMPEMDGYQAAQYIREVLNYKTIPIIAFTASSSSDIEKKVLQSGMNDYIVKPFEPSNFYSIIARHTGRKNQEMKTSNNTNQNNQHINLNYLWDASAGNKSFISEMIQIFLRQTPEMLLKLDALSASEDWEEFRKVIHKMKPTISMMGIKNGEALVRSIEGKAKAKAELESIPEELQKFKEICEASCEELKTALIDYQE